MSVETGVLARLTSLTEYIKPLSTLFSDTAAFFPTSVHGRSLDPFFAARSAGQIVSEQDGRAGLHVALFTLHFFLCIHFREGKSAVGVGGASGLWRLNIRFCNEYHVPNQMKIPYKCFSKINRLHFLISCDACCCAAQSNDRHERFVRVSYANVAGVRTSL